MAKTKGDWMVYLAVFSVQAGFIYELCDMCQEGEMNKLSWVFVLIGFLASALGLIYGIINKITPFIITGIIDVVLSTVLLSIKTVAQIKNKDTEKELK